MAISESGFARIRALPEDRLTYLRNWLMRGGEVMALARHIQQEWKIWTDVTERTIQQQLNRYRQFLSEQASKDGLPGLQNEHGALVVKATRSREIDPLERLVALVEIQERRLQMFLNKEAQVQMPLSGVDKVLDSTKELLKDIQKVRFDLGMDEFKGVLSGSVIARGASKTVQTTMPNGATQTTTTQLYEAVHQADQILGRALIPSNLKVLGREIGGDGADGQGPRE